jgi:hypothetical protein
LTVFVHRVTGVVRYYDIHLLGFLYIANFNFDSINYGTRLWQHKGYGENYESGEKRKTSESIGETSFMCTYHCAPKLSVMIFDLNVY